jgi:hypothetical protein
VADNPLKCFTELASWFEKHSIEQATPLCIDDKGPKRSEAMRIEPNSNLPAVFTGLDCAQVKIIFNLKIIIIKLI